ncbi:MAG: transposase [Acidobacteria bacterium]|nr:transposase [Acidobacteriota bacterium]
MWNDTDIPLAYLISFRCYGTWLPGDRRGSIDRFHNRYQTPYRAPNPSLNAHSAANLKSPPVYLDAERRKIVEEAIRELCDAKNWLLHAINVRTNHVHKVVSIGEDRSSRALNALKARATRRLRENNRWNYDHSPWAEKGSRRRLWNERSIATAIEYVLNGQGAELPVFD